MANKSAVACSRDGYNDQPWSLEVVVGAVQALRGWSEKWWKEKEILSKNWERGKEIPLYDWKSLVSHDTVKHLKTTFLEQTIISFTKSLLRIKVNVTLPLLK